MTISLDSGGGYTGVSWKGSSETSIHNIINTSACTFYAPLKSSLILSKGTGDPTWSRATKAWGFNELGYLEELASGCAFFGGARLVRNLCPSNSDNFSGATLGRCSIVSAAVANHRGTNTAVKYLLENIAGAHYARISTTAYAGMVIRVSVVVKRDEYQYISVRSGQETTPEAFNLTTNTWINAAQTETVARSFEVIDATWIRLTVASTVSTGTKYFGAGCSSSLGSDSWAPAGTENFTIADVSICDVTNYDASYVPEYVSVGVASAPYYGAGIDGAKYFETDWQGAPIAAANLLGFRREAAATNNLLHSRDLSNAAWSTKTNITAAKTATGLDGIANTATTLTATAADAIILQPITLASAARCSSAYVKRRTGTGTISFTQDGGSTWTDITAQINGSTWSRVQITSTLANPSTGFKISTSGDAIDVDCVQNEAGAVATSPIVTTTATVTRNQDSLTYQLLSNLDDIAGTISVITQPLVWTSGGAVGSVSNGLLLSAANSGVVGNDGTNTANGPAGSPTGTEKLALRWGGGAMTAASGGTLGTPGTYDGSLSLANIGIGVGSYGYFNNVAIFNYTMTDAEQQAITT
ncbi:MAG: hypothetical protein IPK44_24510 [Candidatus Accumulibacter sp.]|uniref:phage head spike fiber domain-containing protein n=1 Tax=Accumulibacter sp. TaxID=2053492 RepID=UPI002589B2AC|nr:hypothetical protein [Accumulibacter sp.]MBK8117453.1 hypothetical protein [Accumulibacter sp.]